MTTKNDIPHEKFAKTFKGRFRECKTKADKVERANCMYDVLYDISRLQDKVQLSIPRVNESSALSLNVTNFANALMLEVSKWHGDIEPIVKHRYAEEKINKLQNEMDAMKHDLKVAENYPEMIFDNIRFKKNKLVRTD